MPVIDLKLETFKDGVAFEAFEEGVKEVAKDLDDPTKVLKPRKLILTFGFNPVGEDNPGVLTEFTWEVKRAPRRPVKATCSLSRGESGQLCIDELTQSSKPGTDDGQANIFTISSEL